MREFCSPFVDHSIVWLEHMLKVFKELKQADKTNLETVTLEFPSFSDESFSTLDTPSSTQSTQLTESKQSTKSIETDNKDKSIKNEQLNVKDDVKSILESDSLEFQDEKDENQKKWTLCLPYFSKMSSFAYDFKNSIDSLEKNATIPNSPIVLGLF